MSSLGKIGQRVYFVSTELHAHRDRWTRVLDLFFDEVVNIFDSLEARSDNSLPSNVEFLVTTDLSKTSPRYSRIINTNNHIAISNSLDLMLNWGKLTTAEGIDELRDYSQIWVDTRWAMDKLRSLEIENVHYVPWGLEDLDHPWVQFSAEQPSTLLVPRCSGPHYNPELLVATAINLLAIDPSTSITFLGLPEQFSGPLRSLEAGTQERLNLLAKQSEHGFLNLLNSHSHILMAPKTDGASISMLQSIFQGRPVISTPTIGAFEWLSSSENNFVANDFSNESLIEATLDALRVAPSHDSIEDARLKIKNVADLKKNAEQALARL